MAFLRPWDDFVRLVGFGPKSGEGGCEKSNMGCSPGHSWATLGGDERPTAVTQSEPDRSLFDRAPQGAEYFPAGHASSILVTRS
jgi:hypothetical protein